MPETLPSVLDRFLGSDATIYGGPSEVTPPYGNKMLLAALQEAQSVVRSYDTKAQIVGVGYILSLNLVLHFGDLLATHAPRRPAVLRGGLGYRHLADPAVWASALSEPEARRKGTPHKNVLWF
jgi:hypothetical protein